MSFPSSIWFCLAAVLCLAEFFIPGLFVIFFAIGGLLVGILQCFFHMPLWMEISIWLFLSVASLLGFRRFLPKTFLGKEKVGELPDETEEFAGEDAVVTADILPGIAGKVLFHGTTWNARGIHDRTYASGAHVTVKYRDNLTLFVE